MTSKTFSLLACLLMGIAPSSTLVAQWMPVDSLHTFVYDQFMTLATDSVYAAGQDLTYRPYRILDHEDDDRHCVNLRRPNWFGEAMRISPNGWCTIVNGEGDSIYVQTSAPLGTHWPLYTWPNGTYIEATVTAWDTMTAWGHLDSVKTITFQTKDSAGLAMVAPPNGHSLLLSKHHGFLRAYPFRDFPDSMAWSSPLQQMGFETRDTFAGTATLGTREVFDFHVGDTLHIRESGRWWYQGGMWWYSASWLVRTVTGVEEFDGGKTITFRDLGRDTSESSAPTFTTTVIDRVQTETYHYDEWHLNQLPYAAFKVQPSSTRYYAFDYEQTTLPFLPPSRPHRMGLGIEYSPPVHCASGHELPTLGSWGVAQQYFIKGLGGPYFDGGSPIMHRTRVLHYYRKGDEVFGSPMDLDHLLDIPSPPPPPQDTVLELSLSPNPARDIALLRSNRRVKGLVHIMMTTLDGKKILDRTIDYDLSKLYEEIYLDGMAPGVYHVQVRTREKALSTKLLMLPSD